MPSLNEKNVLWTPTMHVTTSDSEEASVLVYNRRTQMWGNNSEQCKAAYN